MAARHGMKAYLRRLPVEPEPTATTTPREVRAQRLAAPQAAGAAAEAPGAAEAPVAAEAAAPRPPFTAADAPDWLKLPQHGLLAALARPSGTLVPDASCRPGAVFSVADQAGQELFLAIKKATNYEPDVKDCEVRLVPALRKKASVNALYLPADTYGTSPLGCAIIYAQSVNVVQLLLRLGADPNLMDHTGQRPLHTCVYEGRPGCAQALLEAGADPDLGQLAHVGGAWRYGDSARELAARPCRDIDVGLDKRVLDSVRDVIDEFALPRRRAPLAMMEPRPDASWQTGGDWSSLTNDTSGDRPNSAKERRARIELASALLAAADDAPEDKMERATVALAGTVGLPTTEDLRAAAAELGLGAAPAPAPP